MGKMPNLPKPVMEGTLYGDAVRAVAAYVLLWNEPVAAELPLIEATRDAVPAVVAEATNTLEYYPSLRVIHRLHELLDHSDATVREEAGESFQSIRGSLIHYLSGERMWMRDRHVPEHIRSWLGPRLEPPGVP